MAVNISCTKLPCYPPTHYAPEPDAPYTAEEISVQTSKGHILAGTLTLPSDSDPPYPAVLLMTGSGPHIRDHQGTQYYPIASWKPFRQIADEISRKGIAVLRMDDQGAGCSEGGPIENVTIQEVADDYQSGIKYLRGRKDIDKERIGLLGLSEGGIIGPMIAASDPSIRALVIMAGTATNGFKIIEYQHRLKIQERSELSDAEIEKELANYMEGFNQYISRGEGTIWFRSFLDYMPLPAAQNVFCPVLILHGDKDAQVPVNHAHLLAKAIRSNGNKDVTVKIYSNHNHLFLKDSDGSRSGYIWLMWHTNKLSEDVLKTIAEWLAKRLAE